jgi:hypothetical protein
MVHLLCCYKLRGQALRGEAFYARSACIVAQSGAKPEQAKRTKLGGAFLRFAQKHFCALSPRAKVCYTKRT